MVKIKEESTEEKYIPGFNERSMADTVVKEECECEMNVHPEDAGEAPGEAFRVKEEMESVQDCGPPGVKIEEDSEPSEVIPSEPTGRYSGCHKSEVTAPVELKTETIKIFVCEICGIKFAASSFLESHVQIRHHGDKPFACTGCDYTCRHPSDLKRHLMIHTGEKPYACNVCDYKSRHLGTLKRHLMKSSHSKRELLCHSCDYRTRSIKRLKRHLLSHSGIC